MKLLFTECCLTNLRKRGGRLREVRGVRKPKGGKSYEKLSNVIQVNFLALHSLK
jgi:hypothetical protein